MNCLVPWFALIVGGQLLYHSIARGVDPRDSALATVFVAYATGVLLLLGVAAAMGEFGTQRPSEIGLARGVALGIAVTAIEVGFIMAYRNGLPVSNGALATLSVTTLLLIPIGLLVFRERIGALDVIGVGALLVGLLLLAR